MAMAEGGLGGRVPSTISPCRLGLSTGPATDTLDSRLRPMPGRQLSGLPRNASKTRPLIAGDETSELLGAERTTRAGEADRRSSMSVFPSEAGFEPADGGAQLASEDRPITVQDGGLQGDGTPDGTSGSSPERAHSMAGLLESPKLGAVGAVERCMAAAVKGFVIGSGLKGGLALFGVLGRLRRRASSRSGGKDMAKTAGSAARSAVQETLRYGLFLGTFAGGYCCVDEGIAAIGGLKRTARWRPLLAGAAAGPALLLTGRDTGHTSMALYILLRAAVLGARCGIKSPRWGWLFRPLTWQHGDALLMCISSAQILYAWILEPHSLPSSYVSFLNKHGGKDPRVVAAVKEVAAPARPLPSLAAVEAAYREHERLPGLNLDPYMKIPCGMLHPHQLCLTHFVSFLWRAYLRSIPVYLPVYVIPALLVHRKALLHRPLPILSKTAVGAARSSFFLAFYCSSAWLWTCTLHQLAGRCNGATLAAGTFPAGLAVLFEKKSRRMELALYCLSRAIESFGICASEWGWLGRLRGVPKRLDVALFSLATAGIMHCYNNERDVFRSKYLNVLDWVFGVPPLLTGKQAPATRRPGHPRPVPPAEAKGLEAAGASQRGESAGG